METSREALISARLDRCLSIKDAAAALGMQARTLMNAEDGERINMTTARKCSAYYELPVTVLFPDWVTNGGRWHRNGQ